MRKKLFVNDNTMELLRDLASNGYSFTEACKILRRNPWHVRDTAEDKGRNPTKRGECPWSLKAQT